MASLGQNLRGDDSGLNLIKQIFDDYHPVNDSEKFELVKSVFKRPSYDKDFIAEINKLDMNDNYAVYICAYLMTAYQSEADYAFSLLIALLPKLEEQLIQILGEDVIPIVNHERSKDCIVLNFRLLINQNAKNDIAGTAILV